MKNISFTRGTIALLAVLIISLLASLGVVFYYYRTTYALLIDAEEKISAQAETIQQTEENNRNLMIALTEEQERMSEFEEQIKDISGVVGALDKLSKTDPELLKKYSKVYFLNENYGPTTLATIKEIYLSEKDKPEYIQAQTSPFLEKLLRAAEKDDIDLRVVSAYRSFAEQASIKSGYNFVYGAGTANQFSAEQGYSEHQLGTTVDFATPETGVLSASFKETPAYQWLLDHAYTYGFILSYPENNGYYQFEPWHWRFVGITLATELHKKDMHFYDMDQREIDEHLINLFDSKKS